ncbi:glutaredoxin domain-containing protein (plasmid) [Coraliomargarita sp. W4R53]
MKMHPVPSLAVVVYTAGPACVQCKMTKQVMAAARIPHTVVDLTEESNAAARDYVTEDLGYSQAPIVVVDDRNHWAGFQPARIKALASLFEDRSPGVAPAPVVKRPAADVCAAHVPLHLQESSRRMGL